MRSSSRSLVIALLAVALIAPQDSGASPPSVADNPEYVMNDQTDESTAAGGIPVTEEGQVIEQPSNAADDSSITELSSDAADAEDAGAPEIGALPPSREPFRHVPGSSIEFASDEAGEAYVKHGLLPADFDGVSASSMDGFTVEDVKAVAAEHNPNGLSVEDRIRYAERDKQVAQMDRPAPASPEIDPKTGVTKEHIGVPGLGGSKLEDYSDCGVGAARAPDGPASPAAE